jgi:fatty-acyl-CoA synthase
MIVTGGFNVFPREVEDVIAGNPAVSAVAVVGVPDPKWGEAVTALVVAPAVGDDASAREKLIADLAAAVKEAKGSVQVPKHVLFVDAIPLTGLGKPDKKAAQAKAVDLLSLQ